MTPDLWKPRIPEALALPSDRISSVALGDHAIRRTVFSNLRKFSELCGIGFTVGKNIGNHVDNYSATNSDKIDDLRFVMADPLVKVILCSTGGYSAAGLLRYKDQEVYDLFNEKSVLWGGYSDAKVISMFLLAQLNLVSASCPNAWGLYSDWNDLTRQRLKDFCFGRTTELYSDHMWSVQREGEAEGVMIVANTGTLRRSFGTSHDVLAKLAKDGTPVLLFCETYSDTYDEVLADLNQLFDQQNRVNFTGFVFGGRSAGMFAGPYKDFFNNNRLTDIVGSALPPEIPWGIYHGYGHPEFGPHAGFIPKSDANLFMETIPFGAWGKLTLGDQCRLTYDCPVAV